MIIGDKSAADTQNLPEINHLLKPMNILFPSCVKNKALRIQWPEISVECVSADALRCVCGVIRNSWWPMKKQQEALHVHRHMGGSLHGLAHYRGKVGLQRAELNGSLKKV